MTGPTSPEQLWQSHTEEETIMPLNEIRARAQAFQHRIGRRNTREYVAAGVGTALLGTMMWWLPGILERAAALVLLAGVFCVVFMLRRDGAARDVPADASAESCLAFHRRELARQRDVLRRAGTRDIGVLLPGVALLLVSSWSRLDAGEMLIWALSAGLAVAIMGVVSVANLRAAGRLQQEIDALEL